MKRKRIFFLSDQQTWTNFAGCAIVGRRVEIERSTAHARDAWTTPV